MKEFLRAIRMALRYRFTIAGIVCSSLLVGVLWGANIGVVYPFVEIIFQRKSLHGWLDEKLDEAHGNIERLRRDVAQLEHQRDAAGGQPAPSSTQLLVTRERLAAEERAVARLERIKPWVTAYLPSDPVPTMFVIVSALLVGTILKCAFIVMNTILVGRLVQLTIFDLRKQFFRQALRWDMARFSNHHSGELLARFTNDVGCLAGGLSTLFGKAIREPLKMIACLIGAALISWQLLIFSLLVSPPALYLMRRLAQSIKRANRRLMEETSLLFQRISETFEGIVTVKAFAMEAYERNRFHHAVKQYYHKTMKIVIYGSLTKPITEMLGIGVISLSLVAGVYLVVNQETHLLGIRMCSRPLSLGSLLLFYSLLAGVSDPARKMTEIFTAIQGGFAAAERVFSMLDYRPVIRDPEEPRTVPRPHRELAFDGVSFHYKPEQPVLRDIDLKIPFGETIAIVGPNGCGKTTLIKLLPRFYDPVDGSIRLDEVDLREMRIRDIRDRIGMVTQQTHLFCDTVRNNIRYGSPQATDDDVIDAARRAHAHRFITENLAQGYDTIVGHRGGRLSGGQRQRIALARVILRDPEILILDEATSQIDPESEQLIHQTLREFAEGRTAIIVTHRMSTLHLANRIVVMNAGRIEDVGTHEELMSRCEVYCRLHDIHFRRSA